MSLRDDLVQWSHEQRCLKAVDALETHGFTAHYCSSLQEAFDYIVSEAADAATVGFGGSMTIVDMAVEARLRAAGKEILNHGAPGLLPEERLAIMRRQQSCDLFLTGCNAVTLTGEIINIDATGNRVSAMTFGPAKVIVVVSRNKLVDGMVDDAIARVKEWASPPNAKRISAKTPCAVTGACADCNSPDRICRVITVMERKPRLTDLHVLVVNEDAGF